MTAAKGLTGTSLFVAFDTGPPLAEADVADARAVLRVALRDLGRSTKVNDAWIAAIAIARGVPEVTQDDDFAGAPMVEVVRV